MPTYVLTTEDPDGGPAEWQVGGGGGLSPDLTTSLNANWPRDPAELHLWAPAWGVATTFTASDTIYLLDVPGIPIANGAGRWAYAIGPTGGGDQGYSLAFNTTTTLFGDGPFTPSAARVSYISTLTSTDASPVQGVATIRIYGTDEDGERFLAASFDTDLGDAPVLAVTGATPASFTVPLTGVALPISGRAFITLGLLLATDDAMSNNVEFLLDGLHLTFE